MSKIDVTRPSNFHKVLKNCVLYSLRKTVGTDSGYVTSSSYSNFERLNISLKENIPDGVDPNSDGHDYRIRKNEGKYLWFSADCMKIFSCALRTNKRNRHVHMLHSSRDHLERKKRMMIFYPRVQQFYCDSLPRPFLFQLTWQLKFWK